MRPHRANFTTFLCCVIASLAAAALIVTAVRIELLNAEAGHILPRMSELRGTGETAKWRSHSDPTTSAESAQNQLRGIVSTWGLAQYPFALATTFFALFILHRSARRGGAPIAIIATAILLIALAAIALAIYRGYWSSLGW